MNDQAEVAPRAWLVLAAGEDRQHGGNQGYHDEPDAFYSWDEKVDGWDLPAVGDLIVLRDKASLLGASVIESIEAGTGSKEVRRCPQCGKSTIKNRKKLTPSFRCFGCKHETDTPTIATEAVTTLRANYEAGWIDLNGRLSATELRALCHQPKSQHSIRSIDWQAFAEALERVGVRMTGAPPERRGNVLPGGHRKVTTRARLGQRQFKLAMLRRFGHTCAFTGEAPGEVLDAAHLYSYAELGEHHENGGLLLRRDLHRLFDCGLLAVEPKSLTIDVAPPLSAYPTYVALHKSKLQVKVTEGHRNWFKLHWAQHRENP